MLGIDIGGSGIKGAPVDLATGELTRDRHKILTPQPSVPEAVAEVVAAMVEHFDWDGPFGCTFPAIVRRGVTLSAANVDAGWIGVDAGALLGKATGLSVTVLNDADAAGIAEMAFGVGRNRDGVVILLTLGTGIGSALFVDGVLVPNTEFGHLQFGGMDAERYAAARIRRQEKLSYEQWAGRVDGFLHHLERIFSPDLFIIGGGVSRKIDRYRQYLTVETELVPALLRNQAGIVGAALTAGRLVREA